MAQAERISKKCTLTSSSNKFLSYPVKGIIEDVEYSVRGEIMWATFRKAQGDGSYSCPVMVRNVKIDS